jgi:hypothetical protein
MYINKPGTQPDCDIKSRNNGFCPKLDVGEGSSDEKAQKIFQRRSGAHPGVDLGYGRVEIDKNLVANAIRPAKLGVKNWLFIGCREAGRKAA